MSSHGSLQHMNLIQETVEDLRKKGYNAVNCLGAMPDAVATKDNKIYAVEALVVGSIPSCGWHDLDIVKKKRQQYSMFDNVLFTVNKRNKRKDVEMEETIDDGPSEAEQIVNGFIIELQQDR